MTPRKGQMVYQPGIGLATVVERYMPGRGVVVEAGGVLHTIPCKKVASAFVPAGLRPFEGAGSFDLWLDDDGQLVA